MHSYFPPPFSTGMGYDVHPFADGRKMVLAGVNFETGYGLQGHSDADVVLHALCDALLGAAGLRDIGYYFPNSDPKWKDADSRILLRETVELVRGANWKIGNVDMVVIAEKPKIGSRIDEMKTNIATDLEIPTERIGIKATTNEGMGFVGRGEGIAALANVLLWR